MPATKVRVKIVERDGEFFVEPPIAVLDPTQLDFVKLFNTTTEDLVFRLENTAIFGGGQNATGIVRAGKSVTWTSVAAPDGQHSYQILMVKSGKKAKGNSDPVIIIDNP